MRTWAFLLLIAIGLTLQTVVVPRCAAGAVRFDVMLVLTFVLTMHARHPFSYACGAAVGLAVSTTSVEPLGLFILSYGLAGAVVAAVRDLLFIHCFLVQFVVAGCTTVAVQAGWLLYRLSVFPVTSSDPGTEVRNLLTAALTTAVATPIVSLLIRPFTAWLGLRPAKYHARGWEAVRRG